MDFKTVLLVVLCLAAAGCSAKRPVLYPNAYLNSVGQAQAQQDIDECWRMAEAYVSSEPGKNIAKGAVKAGAVGAAAGAASGAVWGHAGRGAAAGAAGAAAAATMHGIFQARDPNAVFQNFVDRCLMEKGYEPIGWK